MTLGLRYLCGQTAPVNRDWAPWLEQTATIYDRLLKRTELPFHDNEQASVSVLVGAAYCAGYLSMAEYGVERGESKYGVADLWLEANNTDYWFEFKRADAVGRHDLKWAMKQASDAFGSAKFDKGYFGYAAVIAATREMNDSKLSTYEAFAGEADVAVHIGPKGKRGAYLYFKLARQA